MKDFMGPDFLLESEVARRLYHDCAADLPIYDYHCHLPPKEIAEDRRFDNLAQIWLDGDHYKWRAMRTVGFPEELVTGNASDYDKYMALARTIPQCIGNPLYHWTHLELKRPFGISNKIFGPDTAEAIWHESRMRLAEPAFSARGLLQQMNVRMLGTTDDPTDDLRHHRTLAQDKSFPVQVLPSWRPDPVFKIELNGFPEYLDRLAEAADIEISSFSDLLAALERRMDHFDEHGCRAADHGIEVMRYAPVPEAADLDRILARRRRGEALSELEVAQFSTALQLWLARAYELRGWVMQLHIGPMRNNSSRRFRELGANVGCDSIGDRPYAEPLSRFLDELDSDRALPRTILYGINPRDNEMLATMAGNFQGDGVPGKVQFGAAWWFNDQKDGMIRHLTCLSQMGLLSQFVGMLTDSRSFLSYTRHEYFRRILCNMIGGWVEKGEAPADFDLLSGMIQNICCDNTKTFFGLDKVKLM